MKKKWKLILGLIILVAVVVTVMLQYSKAIEVNILQIEPRIFSKAFEEEGKVISDDEFSIFTTYGGKIENLPVEEGQAVEKGELLVSFDSSEAIFQISQLQAQLKSIKAQYELERSKISLEKMEALYQAGAISQKEYEDAKNTANSLYYPGQIEAIMAQIDLLQYRIDESRVYAPSQGIISNLSLKQGMIVAAGSQVMKVLQKSDYKVEVYVLTEDAASILAGMKVELIQSNKEQDIVFAGEVEEIAPAAIEKTSALGLIEQRIKVVIKAQTPKELALRPGYALDVRFITQTRENCIIVPKTALFPFQGSDALWIVENGLAKVRKVTTSIENDREVIVEQGLETGDKVILNPQQEGLKEDTKIKAN